MLQDQPHFALLLFRDRGPESGSSDVLTPCGQKPPPSFSWFFMAHVFNSITIAHLAFLIFKRKTSKLIVQMKILVQTIKKCALLAWYVNVICLLPWTVGNKSVCASRDFNVPCEGLTIQTIIFLINISYLLSESSGNLEVTVSFELNITHTCFSFFSSKF